MPEPNSVQYESREDWLAGRRKSLGASESPAVLGELEWQTPFSLWCQKTGIVDRTDPTADVAERLEWGLRLEEPIAKAAAERAGRELTMATPFEVFYSIERPWMSATPDAYQHEPSRPDELGLLQIKNGSEFARRYWFNDAGQPQAPLAVEIQLQHELYVTGFAWGSIAVLLGGNRLLGPLDYERDPVFESAVIPELEAFWECVQTGDAPSALDASRATKVALGKMRVRSDAPPITLSEDAGEWAREFREAQAVAKAHQEKAEALRNALAAELLTREASIGVLPDGGHVEISRYLRRSYTVRESTIQRVYIRGKR